jgi:hypothetical protein
MINKSDHKDLSLLAFKREIAGRQTERLFNVAQLDISLTVLQTGRSCLVRIALTTRVLAVSFIPLSYPNLLLVAPLVITR